MTAFLKYRIMIMSTLLSQFENGNPLCYNRIKSYKGEYGHAKALKK